MIRLVSALITIAVALCGYVAMIHWHDEPPLLIDGAMLAQASDERFCDVKPHGRSRLAPGAPIYPGSVQPRKDKGVA